MSVPFVWLNDSAHNIAKFKECFDENESSRTLEHLKWQYLSGFKYCKPLVALGIANPSDVNSGLSGIYATIQNRFVMNNSIVVGVQSLDTLTSKEFRGKGLFNSLARRVYEECASENIAFVYGFPNKNSVHGFVNKLGWKLLDPVPFLIKPINLSYILSKIPVLRHISKLIPRINLTYRSLKANDFLGISENIEYESKYDNLWAEFSKNIVLGIQRDSEYLDWRLSRPGEVYKNAAIFNASGELQAICIYTIKCKHGGRIGYIMDLIHRDDSVSCASHLLDFVVAKMTLDKCDAVLTWCFNHSPNISSYKKSGFFSMPVRLRPIELHFGARSFKADSSEILENRSSWYISYMDSDTV